MTFRPEGQYFCIFGTDPYGLGLANTSVYNPVGGYAPMGAPLVPYATGTYVSPTELQCLSPSWQNPLVHLGDPPRPINGPVDVVIVDQNATGLSRIEIAPGEFRILNVVFYQPAAWSWLQPTITGLTPATGSGYGFEPFTVSGHDFYPGHVSVGGIDVVPNRIRFGPMEVDADYVNDHTLTGHTPGYFRCTALTVDVSLIPPRLPSWVSQENTIHQPITTLPAAYAYDSTWWKYTGLAMWWAFLTCEMLVSTEWPFVGDVDYKFLDRVPPFEWEWKGPQSPGDGWTPGPPPDDPNGWWTSVSEFRGDVFVVSHTRPANPRTWTDIGGFAAGSAGMLGGSPGIATTFRNRLIYAATGYTATDDPPLRMFDGSYDRELATIPPSATGHAKAVVSLLTAAGTIFVSSWDAGTDASTWTGRVFRLDIETAVLTPIGKALPAGHLPYALAWHNGRLWCGSHRGTPGAGKIFSVLPEQGDDALWVEDHDLGTVQSVAAMVSFQGKLYIGTTGDATHFGTVIARSPDGSYATAEIGLGGSATASNGYLALLPFKDALFATFWNGASPAFATIRKTTDGATWTTSYTGTGRTLRPFITLGIDAKTLFAVGGGLHLSAAVLSTEDGVTWTDLTGQLPEADKTALPAFGGVGY